MARRGRIPLSERVYRSLQGDLAAGVLVPTERLREERLAEIYGVSRTPVREALARLLADGLIERLPDGLYPYRPRLDELADLYELRILLESHGIHRLRTDEPVDVAAEPNPVATTVAAETVARPTAPPPATETVRPATAGGSAWPATGDSVARPAVSESDTTPPSPTPDSLEQAADAVPRTGTAPADPTGGWNAAAGDAGTAETRRTRAVHPVSRRPSETAAREPTTRQPTPDLPCQPAPRLPSQLTPRLPDQPTPHLPSQARARSARPRYDAAMIERELEIWQDLRAYPPPPGAELIAADERFHSRLLAASGNTALADALATVHARVRPIRALDIPTPERIAIMTAEHIAIAEQLLAGDLDQGLSVLVTHITTSRDHVLARAEHALRLTKLARALRD